MRVVTPKKKNVITKRKKDDPLSRLHQIHEDTPLDDIENNNVIRDLIINDEVLGLNILNRLDALIQGLKKERISRINRAWDRRFITAFETMHI